jgi:hypothetical protein
MKIMFRDVFDFTKDYEEITMEELNEYLYKASEMAGLRVITLADIKIENGITVMYYDLDSFEC